MTPGYNALEYDTKYAIQIRGTEAQGFGYKDMILRPVTGQSYRFNNQIPHFVFNASWNDRITLILSVKTKVDESVTDQETQ